MKRASPSLAWLLTLPLIAGLPDRAIAATAPATSARQPGIKPDDPLIAEARPAAMEKRLPAFATRVESELRPLLDDPANANLDELTRLAVWRQWARYFARLKEPGDGAVETIASLADQPKLLTALMLSVTDSDPPDRVVEVLRGLRQDHRPKLEEFADLASAVCVVWDEPERFGAEEDVPVNLEEVSRVFDYFARNASRLKLDPRKLPAELLVYVVDGDLSEREVTWAAERNATAGVDVAASFMGVRYVENPDYDRGRRGEDERAYVLPNIARRGGNCTDAAYYAAQLGKLGGVPSTACRGSVAGFSATVAWVVFLDPAGRRLSDARLRDHAGWPGVTIDPQTGEALDDADAALLGAILATAPRDRLGSAAMLRCYELTPVAQRVALLKRAIDLSPANRAAWRALADLAATERFDAEQAKPIEELIAKHLRAMPGASTSLRLRMLRGRGSIELAAGLDSARKAAGGRRDLLATIGIARADRQIEDRQYVEATATLLEVLRDHATPPVAMAVLGRLDDALRKQEDVARLAAVYGEVFNALAKPAATRWGRATAYYQIGARYAAVLEETDQTHAAQQVRAKIDAVVTPG